jgi:hypothetical protein
MTSKGRFKSVCGMDSLILHFFIKQTIFRDVSNIVTNFNTNLF